MEAIKYNTYIFIYFFFQRNFKIWLNPWRFVIFHTEEIPTYTPTPLQQRHHFGSSLVMQQQGEFIH